MKDTEENNTDKNLKADKANHLEEWKQARGILQFFDDKSYDLRKYGFTFVTALLTAEGILLPKGSDFASAPIRFAVYSVTLLLILALHLIDNNFRVYKRAANTRALVLEKKLNLELSETITDRYRDEHVDWRITVLYCIFIFGVLFLGLFSLYGEWLYFILLILIALAGSLLTYRMDISYKYKHRENWTVSPLECGQNGRVFITITNYKEWMDTETLLNSPEENQERSKDTEYLVKYLKGLEVKERKRIKIRKPIHFREGDTIFEIINEVSGEYCDKKTASRNIDIYDNQTWIINRDEFKENGVYQIFPRNWPLPLNRRIIVTDRTP